MPEISRLNIISMYYTGFFTVNKQPGLESQILLSTTPESQIVRTEDRYPERIHVQACFVPAQIYGCRNSEVCILMRYQLSLFCQP